MDSIGQLMLIASLSYSHNSVYSVIDCSLKNDDDDDDDSDVSSRLITTGLKSHVCIVCIILYNNDLWFVTWYLFISEEEEYLFRQ